MHKISQISVLGLLLLSLSGCLGTIIGTTVDAAIEVVKIPFKVGGAVIDVATDDDLTDLSGSTKTDTVDIDSEEAAVSMETRQGL